MHMFIFVYVVNKDYIVFRLECSALPGLPTRPAYKRDQTVIQMSFQMTRTGAIKTKTKPTKPNPTEIVLVERQSSPLPFISEIQIKSPSIQLYCEVCTLEQLISQVRFAIDEEIQSPFYRYEPDLTQTGFDKQPGQADKTELLQCKSLSGRTCYSSKAMPHRLQVLLCP